MYGLCTKSSIRQSRRGAGPRNFSRRLFVSVVQIYKSFALSLHKKLSCEVDVFEGGCGCRSLNEPRLRTSKKARCLYASDIIKSISNKSDSI